jgi:hypothetical protein
VAGATVAGDALVGPIGTAGQAEIEVPGTTTGSVCGILGQLVDFVGNLLDYDPTNTAYREQLVNLLNDAQTRCLTDRPWAFAMRDRVLQVFTDGSQDIGYTNGTAVLSGTFDFNASTVTPGSSLTGAVLLFTDSSGATHEHTVTYVESASVAHIDRPYVGASGTYTTTTRQREVYLPSDCMTVENVSLRPPRRHPCQGALPLQVRARRRKPRPRPARHHRGLPAL